MDDFPWEQNGTRTFSWILSIFNLIQFQIFSNNPKIKRKSEKKKKKKRWSNSYNLLGSVIIFWQVYTKRVETPRACLRSSYWLWLTLKCVTTNSIILSTLAEETRQTAGWQTTVKTAERCRGEAKLGRLLRSCCVTTGCIHLRCCLLTNWDKWGWPRDVKKKNPGQRSSIADFSKWKQNWNPLQIIFQMNFSLKVPMASRTSKPNKSATQPFIARCDLLSGLSSGIMLIQLPLLPFPL